jgi:hypothetical protein
MAGWTQLGLRFCFNLSVGITNEICDTLLPQIMPWINDLFENIGMLNILG